MAEVSARRRPVLPHHWVVFSVVVSAIFVASMDAGMVPVIFPRIEASFPGTPATTLSWVLTAYTMALAALVVTTGRLGDRSGRKRLFIAGLGLFIVGALLCALAPSPGLLIAARLVQGTGHALFTPASIGLILAAFPIEGRTQALGAWVGIGGVAAAVGPTAGGAIAQYADWSFVSGDAWRVAFALESVLCVPLLWRARRVLDIDTPADRSTRLPDPVGVVLLTVTLALTTLVIVQGRNWGWTSPGVLGAAGVALVTGTAFSWRSKRHPVPVIDFELLRRRAYRTSMAVSGLLSLSMFANLVMQSQLLQKAWGYSTMRAGLAVTPLAATAGIVSPLAPRLTNRFGHKPVIIAGMGLTTIGLAMFAVLPGEDPQYLTRFLPATVLIGIGAWGLGISMVNAAASTTLTPDNFGVGMAILQTIRQAGGIVGTALFFGLFGSPSPDELLPTFHRLWALFACICGGALLFAFRLPATRPHTTEVTRSTTGRGRSAAPPSGR